MGDDLNRFLSKIDFEPNSGCWLWNGALDTHGYGQFHTAGKKNHRAHRWYYLRVVGPTEKQLDHLCQTRCCVNPDHLEPVTTQENTRRGNGTPSKELRPRFPALIPRGRHVRGSAGNLAVLTEEIVALCRKIHRPGHPELGIRALARRFGVSHPAMGLAINGITWRHVGGR